MKARGRYAVSSRRMWGDARFRALTSGPPTGRELWLYLMTCRITPVLPGLFVLGLNDITRDLRWQLPGTLTAWAELEEARPEPLALADWEAPLVWLPKAIRHDPPANSNHVKAWVSRWVDLPDSKLLDRVWLGCVGELKRLKPALANVFAHGIPRPCGHHASFRSLPLPLPLLEDAERSRTPAPAREEQAPNQINGSNGSAKPNGGPIRCPIDLKLDDDQLGTLEINNGCKRDDGLKLCSHFAAKWRHNDPQPLASWQRALWTAVVSAWQNPAERSRILPAPGLLEHEENTRALPNEERERLRAWRAEQDAQRAAGGK